MFHTIHWFLQRGFPMLGKDVQAAAAKEFLVYALFVVVLSEHDSHTYRCGGCGEEVLEEDLEFGRHKKGCAGGRWNALVITSERHLPFREWRDLSAKYRERFPELRQVFHGSPLGNLIPQPGYL
jgi:hypothetical protein